MVFVLFLGELLKKKCDYVFRSEVFLIIIFIIYIIIILSFLDTGRQIYGERDLSMVSDQLIPVIHLYMYCVILFSMFPWFFTLKLGGYLYMNLILFVKIISLVAPFSIMAFIQSRGIVSGISEIISILQFGASGMSYNTYVPYLTFPFNNSIIYIFNYCKKSG